MNNEVDAYHPRYTNTEYMTYEAREKRRKRRGMIGALLFIASVTLLIILARSV